MGNTPRSFKRVERKMLRTYSTAAGIVAKGDTSGLSEGTARPGEGGSDRAASERDGGRGGAGARDERAERRGVTRTAACCCDRPPAPSFQVFKSSKKGNMLQDEGLL